MTMMTSADDSLTIGNVGSPEDRPMASNNASDLLLWWWAILGSNQ
jgi:hypothetical protein